MLATFAALVMSSTPAMPVRELVSPLVLAKKKKKAPKAPGSKEKDNDPPEETSEGLDLSEPAPAPAPAPAPVVVAEEPVVKAPEPVTGSFSVVTPHTVGEGQNVLEGAVGWPGVYASYWRGVLGALDVGAKVVFNYGLEGQITRPTIGFRIQVQARYLLFDNGKLSLGVMFAPGFAMYFISGLARPGVILPVTAVGGMQLMPKLNLGVLVELPLVVLGSYGAVLPILVGAAAEYALTDSLLLFAKVKVGPSIWFNGAGLFFTLEGVVGAGFKL